MPIEKASDIPVICIDGPAGVGKGTVTTQLASTLNFHMLDSGSLYRIVGLIAHRRNISFDNEIALGNLAASLVINFTPLQTDSGELSTQITADGDIVTEDIRTESCGGYASKVAHYPAVRSALTAQQHQFKKLPGLIADGRDMGTVIFPEAKAKIFLTASAEIRAERRHKQLKQKGIHANLRALQTEIEARDVRDQNRTTAPLIPAEDAYIIDTSLLSIQDVMRLVSDYVQQQYPDLSVS